MANFTFKRRGTTDYMIQFYNYMEGDDKEQRVALIGIDPETGEKMCTCTVNFPDINVNPGHVWIKVWSENEGMMDDLIRSKIGTPTGRVASAGYTRAYELKLRAAVWKEALARVKMNAARSPKG